MHWKKLTLFCCCYCCFVRVFVYDVNDHLSVCDAVSIHWPLNYSVLCEFFFLLEQNHFTILSPLNRFICVHLMTWFLRLSKNRKIYLRNEQKKNRMPFSFRVVMVCSSLFYMYLPTKRDCVILLYFFLFILWIASLCCYAIESIGWQIGNLLFIIIIITCFLPFIKVLTSIHVHTALRHFDFAKNSP